MNFRQRAPHARMKLCAPVAALLLSAGLFAQDNSPQVRLNISQSSPRPVEPLTQRAIIRDYKFAWANLDAALQSNSAAPLNGLFAGTANDRLNQAVDQQRLN